MSVQISDSVVAVIVPENSLNLQSHGIYIDLIGSHSLLEGGDMTLKLMGCSESTIKKIGIWTYHKG